MTRGHFSSNPALAITRFAIAVIASLVLASAAQAATLSESEVRAFIDSMKAAQQLADEHPELEEDMVGMDETPDMAHLISSSLERLEQHPEVRTKLEDIVRNHGFDSLEEWGQTGDRVYAALIAIGMEGESGNSARQMKQAMAEMEKNPNVSDAQKAQMRQMMSAAMSGMEAAENVPEADKRAVRPYVDELEALGSE